MANLSDFKARIGYGIRPNLFKVVIPDIGTSIGNFDNSRNNSEDMSFLCRSASLPASSLGTVEVPFRGRVIKLPGDRTFESWTITLFADPDLSTRAFLEKWMDKMNEHRSGGGYIGSAPVTGLATAAPAAGAVGDYTRQIEVHQYQRGTNTAATGFDDPHNIIRTYRFINAWPSNISAIDVSYDNNNSIAEYTCEWQYDWWEVVTPTANQAGSGTIT